MQTAFPGNEFLLLHFAKMPEIIKRKQADTQIAQPHQEHKEAREWIETQTGMKSYK